MELKRNKHYELLLINALIRYNKGKRVFVLDAINVYPKVSLEEGLHVMGRCALPLWAGEGLNQASFLHEDRKDIACYEKYHDEILIAQLITPIKTVSQLDDISLDAARPDSIGFNGYGLHGLNGKQFTNTIEEIIKKTDNGRRLEKEFVEKAIEKARLALVPKGWTVVTEGTVLKGDRYYDEDNRPYKVMPSHVSWMSCDVCFSAHKPGTPVRRNDWDDTIIIRKIK